MSTTDAYVQCDPTEKVGVDMPRSHINAFQAMFNSVSITITSILSEKYKFDTDEAMRYLRSLDVIINDVPTSTKKRSADTKKTTKATAEDADPKYPKIKYFPFCNIIYEGRCKSIRPNGGLFTQCLNTPMEGGEYCNTCKHSKRFIGHIKDRVRENVDDVVNVEVSGRTVTPLVNLVDKRDDVTMDDIQQELERLKKYYPEMTIPETNYIKRKGGRKPKTSGDDDPHTSSSDDTDEPEVEKWSIEEAKVQVPKLYENYTKITQLKVKDLKHLAKKLGLDTVGVKTEELKKNVKEFIKNKSILPPPTRGRKKKVDTTTTETSDESQTDTGSDAPSTVSSGEKKEVNEEEVVPTSSVSTTKKTKKVKKLKKNVVIIDNEPYKPLPNDNTKMYNLNTYIVYDVTTRKPIGIWWIDTEKEMFIATPATFEFNGTNYHLTNELNVYKIDDNGDPDLDDCVGKFNHGIIEIEDDDDEESSDDEEEDAQEQEEHDLFGDDVEEEEDGDDDVDDILGDL